MHDHVARMLRDAKERLHDADILSTSLSGGTSASLLRILALEVLLKAAQYVTLGRYRANHDYAAAWQALPFDASARILAVARERYVGHACLADPEALLSDWQFAFTRGRYFFELNQYLTLGEQQENGEAWIDRGAPLEEAQVRYHPLELLAMTDGLIAFLEEAREQ